MKKLIMIVMITFAFIKCFSYTWQSYGPENIETKNLFFLQDYTEPLIIMEANGFYLSMDTWPQSWQYFDYPAKEFAMLNETKLLFVAGGGSYTDGIYSLNIPTLQIELVEECINPYFIKYFDDASHFYAGFDNGLLKSANGLDWETVEFFTGRMCIGMDYYNGHWIVNTVAAVTHLFLSDDNGNTWTESTGNPSLISTMAFTDGGKLYGVFPGTSYSSGLWSSEDYGNSWEIEFYTINLNTVHTVFGESLVFAGWSEPDNDFEGLAIYDEWAPAPGLTFLNDGLPNTTINYIDYRSIITKAAHLYVCTNEGVFVCYDYFVGIQDQSMEKGMIELFPNPVRESMLIRINGQINPAGQTIAIYNANGLKSDELIIDKPGSESILITWNKGNLPAGVYYLVVKTKKETITEKFILL